MKRFWIPLFALLSLILPLIAHAETDGPEGFGTQITFRPLEIRHTSAASVARQANWAFGGNGAVATVGFVDSTIFKRGGTAFTLADTSVAVARTNLALPPIFGPGYAIALADSVLPWIVLRVSQDSTAYNGVAAPTSTMDSVHVSIEWSDDGINWNSFAGTPTYRFDVNFIASGGDGLQNTSLIGVERLNSYDSADIILKCREATWNGVSDIVNLNACQHGTYLRFIIGMDGSGQYKAQIGTWQTNRLMN